LLYVKKYFEKKLAKKILRISRLKIVLDFFQSLAEIKEDFALKEFANFFFVKKSILQKDPFFLSDLGSI
jgi:hypothetical protein